MTRQSINTGVKMTFLCVTCLLGWLCWAEQAEQAEQAEGFPAFLTIAIKIESVDERKAHFHSSVVKVDPASGEMLLNLLPSSAENLCKKCSAISIKSLSRSASGGR